MATVPKGTSRATLWNPPSRRTIFGSCYARYGSYRSQSQTKVSGTVYIQRSYRFVLEGITSENDLMNPEFGAYGEENAWSTEEAKGFIATSVPNRIFNKFKSQNLKR